MVRDRLADIARDHGRLRISALRQVYGSAFAVGIDGRTTLAEVVTKLDAASLGRLVEDRAAGRLPAQLDHAAD